MKVHFQTHQGLGIAMHKIAHFLLKYKPDGVEETSFSDCDITIEHVIGDHWSNNSVHDKQLSARIKQKKFVLMWYCFECSTDEIKTNKFFNWAMENALMVYTTLPLELYGFGERQNVVRGPLGYDHTVFEIDPEVERLNNSIMSTGYVSGTECIEEAYHACKKMGGTLFHVGHNFNWNQIIYRQGEKLTDWQMKTLYCSASFVSGLRREEGFEIPVLEGAACGARPIVFNKPHYNWFRDFAFYIQEGNFREVRDALTNILKQNISNDNILVTEEERKMIRETFAWDVIAKRFWSELLERV